MDFKFLKDNNIKNSCVSFSLNHFKYRFNNKYNLSEINVNSTKPCIFFGIYNTNEWNTYFKYKGPKFILFGGTDINPFHKLGKFNIKLIIINKITNILVLSEKAKNNLQRLNIQSNFFDMNLVNKKLFLPNKNKKKTNKIYCYNGTYGKPSPETYGGKLLILTSQDGNANTVQECEAMNVPVVHNISKYGLKFNNIEDIINHIFISYQNQ